MINVKQSALNLKYVCSFFLKNLIYSVFFLLILCTISYLIPEKTIGFYIISTCCILAALLIVVLWKLDESFKELNDCLLFFYAAYLALNKILVPNDTYLKLPVNVSFQDLWNGDNKIEYFNLLVLFLVAICTLAKAIIAYRTFKSKYKEKS